MAEQALSVTQKRPWIGQRLSLDARDPTPFETVDSFWRAAAQTATIVMCVLLFGVFLFAARSLLLPVLCALVIGMTFGPVFGYLGRRGVPPWLTALAAVMFVVATVNLAVVLLSKPVSEMLGRAPEIATAFKDKLHIFDGPISALAELQATLGIGQGGKVEVNSSRIVESVVTIVTPAAVQFVLQAILFIGTLFFFITGRNSFRSHFVNWFHSREARLLRALKILNDIEANLSGYLLVVTAINLSLGVVAYAMAHLLGLPSPLLWAALAFGLNYIPYVGPGIVYVLLFLVGLLTYPTLWGALLPPAVYMAVTLVEGQFLSPAIIGRRVLSLHPLAIFLGIAFWAWLWGPMGAFLATPILIVFRVTLDHLYPRQKAELPG